MHTYASGKALLVITRNDYTSHDQPHYDITVFLQSLNLHGKGELCYAEESVQELFWCMSMCYMHWLPLNMKSMGVGDTWRVYVQFEATSHRDYWGEYDEELIINKARILRKQKPREYYQCK